MEKGKGKDTPPFKKTEYNQSVENADVAFVKGANDRMSFF